VRALDMRTPRSISIASPALIATRTTSPSSERKNLTETSSARTSTTGFFARMASATSDAVPAFMPQTTHAFADSATVVASRFYVDRRESALNEAGDFLVPKREGLVDDDHIVGEIGELLVDPPRVQGRRTPQEMTVFKSLGLAIEDVASARRIYDRAVATGAGTWFELGGLRDADA